MRTGPWTLVVLVMSLGAPCLALADDLVPLEARLLEAPPPPPRTGAKVLLGLGGSLLLAGLFGTLSSDRCATRDQRGDCVDPRGTRPVYPTLLAVGLAVSVMGSAAWRNDAPEASR